MAVNSLISERLNQARRDLLDLGLRNTLLNYRTPKSRGAEVKDCSASDVYKWLVSETRALTFRGVVEKEEVREDGKTHFPKSAKNIALETAYSEKALQSRLLATYYAARTHIEERGANILFLAVGMLHWFEDDSSQKELRAPLLLIPVQLERTSAREKFSLKYSEEDIEENLSLFTKLKSEFGIKYPPFPDLEDLDPESYLARVAQCVRGMARWSVAQNEISLGFFSFGKFLMYRDLSPDNWCKRETPDASPNLAALIRDGFREESSLIGEDAYLDKHVSPEAVHQVVDVDSSQALALLDVRSGKNLVIQGPPGTGKSQTITNLISDALGRGQRVLFVAEKMAALEVVKRRLDKVGLGDACLELHSHTANKKALLEELKRTVRLGKPKLDGVPVQTLLYKRLRDQLNAYCLAVNTEVGKSGFNPYQLMGELVAIRRVFPGKRILRVPAIDGKPDETHVLEQLVHLDRPALEQKQVLVRSLEKHLSKMGVPNAQPFKGCQLTALLPSDQDLIRADLASAIDVTRTLDELLVGLSALMGIEARRDRGDAEIICKAARRAIQAPHLEGVKLRTGEWQAKRDQLEQLLQAGERLSAIHSKLDGILIAEAWEQNLLEARQVLNTIGRKWWRYLSGDYRRIRNRVAGLCQIEQPKTVPFLIGIVDGVMEAARLRKICVEHEALAATLFGAQWQGAHSDWPVLRRLNEWIIALYRDIGDGKLPDGVIDFLAAHPRLDTLKEKVAAVERSLGAHEKVLPSIGARLAFAESVTKSLSIQTLPAQITDFSQMLDRIQDLQEQITFNNLASALNKEGLHWVVEAARFWPEASSGLVNFFRNWCFEAILRSAYNDREALRTFDGTSHDNVREQFKKLDIASLQLTQIRIAEMHFNGLPTLTGNGQLGVLLREFEKKARHLPIRQLVERSGNAIQAIKPVFMMSPMSIATFVPPKTLEFDLVIFDEASQVKPVDAFGAILRGSQLVVVGDSKQLPPTSFFDALVGEDDVEDMEDDLVTSDMESILGLMAGQGAPQRMLRWHYRSRHESLIALSNKEFYENRLVIFPSPSPTRRGLGLVFHHLPNTTYDRGKSRTNQKEAEVVAKAVMVHARTSPHLTLGVAAFSLAQADAILDQLERLRRQDLACEGFFASHPFEPFFVKNLESVQGDERDIIFISIGYGRTEEGYVSMNFGALNSSGGERRLNVLITRARSCCEVFTNLTHEDIDISRTQSRGILAFKAFLKYAQTGIIDVPNLGSAETESPFEEEVVNALEQAGHKVARQVGSGGFRIDLAVVDPDKPGAYLLGIECDGATYHSSRSARDRDRLRQAVLENLGWRMYRIWSRDWFANTDREIKRALQAIAEAMAWRKEQINPKPTLKMEDISSEAPKIVRGPRSRPVEQELKAQEYVMCDLNVRTNGQELHEVPPHRYAQWIGEVVEVESPVHTNEVARRIVDAADIKRIGNRIESAFEAGVNYAVRERRIERRGTFLWMTGNGETRVRDRAQLPNPSRKLELISPEEVALAIRQVVESSYGIDQEEVAPVVCRLLGFARTTEEMAAGVNKVLAKLIKAGHLKSVDGHVSP